MEGGGAEEEKTEAGATASSSATSLDGTDEKKLSRKEMKKMKRKASNK